MYKATTDDINKTFRAIADIRCKKMEKSEHEVNVLRKFNEAIDKGLDLAKVKEILQPLLNEEGEENNESEVL